MFGFPVSVVLKEGIKRNESYNPRHYFILSLFINTGADKDGMFTDLYDSN